MVYYGMVKGCALEVTRMYENKTRLHLAVSSLPDCMVRNLFLRHFFVLTMHEV